MKPLISVSGNDGSGKSTLIRSIRYYLQDNGYSHVVIPVRLGFTPIMRNLKKILKVSPQSQGEQDKHNKNNSSPKTQPQKQDLVKKLYGTLSIFDLALVFITIHIRRVFNHTILTDRFYHDSWIYYQDKYGKPSLVINLLWKILEKIAGEPDVHFLLILPGEESYRRITSRWDLIEESLEQLKARAKLYAELDHSRLIILDATQPAEIIFQEALGQIQPLFEHSEGKPVSFIEQ